MGQGGNVTITGGVTLTAAGEGGRAVGAGAHSQFDNDLYIADGMIVIAGSGFESRMRVPADERVSSCREHKYAEIRPGPVNVKFEVFGKCAAPPDQEVFPEYRIERPADPAADGCVFGGWYTEAECIHPYDFDEYLAGGTYTDMTLYARWISGCELSVETIWPDEDNNVIWENAAEMEFLTSTSSPKWERSFAAIPIDESFDINDYRVREWVRHTTSNIEPTYAKTYFEDTDGVDSSQGSLGKVLLIPADEDYVADRSYDFYAKIGSYKTGSLVYDTASFEASYSRDQDGNFIITNTQRG